jgi:RHS repeat-associated protein
MTGSPAGDGEGRGGRRRFLPAIRLGVLAIAVAMLVLAVGSSMTLAAGGGSSNSEPESAATSPATSPETPEGVEIPSARTALSDTFALPDGERETRLYEAPVNEQVAPGKWEPIEGGALDPGVPTALPGEGGEVTAEVPERLGAAPVRLSTGEGWVAARLLGSRSEPAEVEGESANYELDGSGASVELSTLADGIKEDILIPGPSAPSTFHFELTASSGLTPELMEDGSVAFDDDAGKTIATLPGPTVSDASDGDQDGLMGALVEASKAVHYNLEKGSGSSWELTVEVSREWLDQPGRAWPVTIDPSMYPYTMGAYFDCTVYSAPPIEGWSRCAGNGYANLAAEAYDRASTPDEYSRTIIFFRLIGSISSSAEVQSADVNLYSSTTAVETNGLQLQGVEAAWDNYVSWKYSGYPNCGFTCAPWAVPGGTGELLDQNKGEMTTASRGGSGPGWWTVPVNLALAQSWVTGGAPANVGVDVEQLGEKEHDCTPSCVYRHILFESSADPVAEQRPYLSLTYIPQAPDTSKLTSPTEGTRTARRLRLRSKWKEPNVEAVSYEYREGKSGVFKPIPPELVQNAEGKAITSWPLSVPYKALESETLYFDAAHATSTLQKKGGIIEVRAIFTGPKGANGYSAPVEAVVNRGTGGPKDPTAAVGPGSVDLLTGDFSTTATDASFATYNSSLEFSRSYNSRPPSGSKEETEKRVAEESKSVLGPGWRSGVSLEEAGGAAWRNLRLVTETGLEWEEVGEGEFESFPYQIHNAVVTDIEGDELAFEETSPEHFQVPPEVVGWTLTKEGGVFQLIDPSGSRTTFSPNVAGEYLPSAIVAPGGATTTSVEYTLAEGRKRLDMIVAPAAPGVNCSTGWPKVSETAGCKALVFRYEPATVWGGPAADGERLSKIYYYAPGFLGVGETAVVADYKYNSEGRLIEEWDPRISPALPIKYSYESNGAMKTITPPGQEPWTLEYGTFDEEEGVGRLKAVKRPSLLTSPSTAQTTIAYEVPLTLAGGGPVEMSGSMVGQWGQTEIPTDATAVFPPDQVPTSSPPSSYSHATVHYMDAEGYEVNTETPSGAGTSNPSVSTSETDEFGNVVRELTPDNRLLVLKEAECKSYKAPECARRLRAEQLETSRVYNELGTKMLVELGPLHQIRLKSGETAEGRLHRVVQYDELPKGITLPTPDPNLPTRETTGAWVNGVLKEEHVTETGYDWALRKPEKTTVLMESGKIEHVTLYNNTTGLPEQSQQPKAVAGVGAHAAAGTTRTVYYTPGTENIAGCVDTLYAGLLCKTEPAEQPATSGLPEMLVTKYLHYDGLGEPTEVTESPGGGTANVRKTITTYDALGRGLTKKIEGGGTAVPVTETIYNKTMGMPEKQQFVGGGGATSSVYNKLGQVTEYKDSNGNVAKTTYDVDGRPVTTTDSKGSQTATYDPTSGLLTKVQDSAAGAFTASYDADGNMVERTLPNGITATTTLNQVDEPTKLAYTKAASCGETGCTWLEESLERSIYGQTMSNTGTLVNDQYSYDNQGRLEEAKETPMIEEAGGIRKPGECITRKYEYDQDSNRTARFTREHGPGGSCVTSEGKKQAYGYDGADRLTGEGIAYDPWGRITSLPAVFAGGHALTTTYYSTNMIASQTQNGITNSYELDATGRQSSRLQGGGGLEGTEAFHYDNGSDGVAWTQQGTTWSRDIAGIGGELAAVQESSGTVTFDLTDLHGDVVASASSSPTATKLLSTYRFDEFGEPESGSAGRFGWLGGKSRRTELASGVIQMGVRSYIPTLGRFLTPDPDPGGSANSYDYANQDPINSYDLNGEKAKKKAAASRGAGSTAVQKRCCGFIHVTIPSPFKAIAHVISHYAAEAVTIAWRTMKKEVQETAHALEYEAQTVEKAERAMENWERRVNPFLVQSFGARESCLVNGAEGFFAIVGSDGADSGAAAQAFANGCVEGAAER